MKIPTGNPHSLRRRANTRNVRFRIGQLTLSTQLIKQNYLVIFPPTQHHSFFRNLPPYSWNLYLFTFNSVFLIQENVYSQLRDVIINQNSTRYICSHSRWKYPFNIFCTPPLHIISSQPSLYNFWTQWKGRPKTKDPKLKCFIRRIFFLQFSIPLKIANENISLRK